MHDRNGAPLAVGDQVLLPATVTSTYEGSEGCNIAVALVEVMYPDQPANKTTMSALNARQVVKFDGARRLAVDLVAAIAAPPEALAPPTEPPAPEAPVDPTPDAGATDGEAEAAEPPARCDCSALPVPHVHEQGGPVALPPGVDA